MTDVNTQLLANADMALSLVWTLFLLVLATLALIFAVAVLVTCVRHWVNPSRKVARRKRQTE